MKLSEFLKNTGITAKEFAKRCNTSEQTISRVLNGADCRLSLAKRIEDTSFGRVSMTDLYNNIGSESSHEDGERPAGRKRRKNRALRLKKEVVEGIKIQENNELS